MTGIVNAEKKDTLKKLSDNIYYFACANTQLPERCKAAEDIASIDDATATSVLIMQPAFSICHHCDKSHLLNNTHNIAYIVSGNQNIGEHYSNAIRSGRLSVTKVALFGNFDDAYSWALERQENAAT